MHDLIEMRSRSRNYGRGVAAKKYGVAALPTSPGAADAPRHPLRPTGGEGNLAAPRRTNTYAAISPRLLPAALSILLIFVVAGFFNPAPAAEPDYPELAGRVVDGANLLSAEDERKLAIDLEALEEKSTDQVVVVTLPSLQGYEIEEFGYRLGRHWGIGQAGKDNGVLLVVAPNERKVRIEVGRGLEPLLTDALSRIIIENAILPRFRAGDFPGGINAGVRDITAVLTGDAEELKARAKSGRADTPDWLAILILVIWAAIFLAVMWSIVQSVRHGAGGNSGSGGGGSSGGSSSGGWSSGSGGFSGGGGGFGGGGASGGW